MVYVKEQPCPSAVCEYLCTVQLVRKQIERLDMILEELGIRLCIERRYSDIGRFIVMRYLHDFSRDLRKSHLEITVRVKHCGNGIFQLVGRCIPEQVYRRHIVLRRIAVHFPVEIYAALVLGDGIAAAARVMAKLGALACIMLFKGRNAAHRGILHDIRYPEGRTEFL